MTVPPVASPGASVGCADDDDSARALQYRRLARRCELLQSDNRRLLHRIHQVRKLTERYRREIEFLAARLDRHGDQFREAKAEQQPQQQQQQPPQQQHQAPVEEAVKADEHHLAAANNTNHNKHGAVNNGRQERGATKRKHAKTTEKPTDGADCGPLVIAERPSDPKRQDRSAKHSAHARKSNESSKKAFY